MKKFFQSRLFKLLFSLALALGLIFLTPDCLSFNWKLLIVGSLFLITNLTGPFSDLAKRIAILGTAGKIWTQLIRIFVGGLFIFSGIIKSNDPTGFSIKLKEYFEIFKEDFSKLSDARPEVVANVKMRPEVLSAATEYTNTRNKLSEKGLDVSAYQDTAVVYSEAMKQGKDPENIGTHLSEYFHDHAVSLAIIVCVSEVALGFLLLLGIWRNLTLWLLLAQIVFFTFLTFYSACYNKVTHCGCFGDFLKLTPWTSFGKDIVLLVAIAFLFAGKSHIKPLFKRKSVNWLIAGIGIAISIWFPIYCYNNLPVWDFLPFYDGADVCKGRQPGKDYKPAVYENIFIYKNLKTGENQRFNDKDYPWQDTLNWTYVDRETKLISEEVDAAKITTWTILDMDGNELGDTLLQSEDYYFLLVMNNLKETETDAELMKKMNDFAMASEKEGLMFLAVTSAVEPEIKEYKFQNQAMFEFATSDDVQLKMMVRSNPGLMLFKGCTMVKKWHYNNFPSYTEVKEKYIK